MKSTTAGSSTGGLVSGRASSVVTPPAAAAALAEAMVSRCSAPGSPMKASMSIRPGATTSPSHSTIRASGGIASRFTIGPSAAILPSTTSAPPRDSSRRSGSISRASRKAMGRGCGTPTALAALRRASKGTRRRARRRRLPRWSWPSQSQRRELRPATASGRR
jgi:hypothetical protein